MPLPEPEVFSHFLPFRRLSPVEHCLLSRRVRIEQYRRGAELAAIGDIESDEIFLLSGALTLIAQDGGRRRVDTGTASALGAISQLRPRQFRVVADSLVEVLLVPLDVMHWLNQQATNQYSVAELELDENDDDDRLFAAMLTDLPQFRVNLPVTRAGAAAIRGIVNQTNQGLAQLAQAAMIEPSVAVRLIGAANHPLSAPGRNKQSCFEAAAHLGVETTRRLLTVFTASEFVPDRYSTIHARFAEAVRRSRECAYLCAQLADLTGTLVAANAYLAGLLHAVGEIAALAYAEPWHELCLDKQRLEACLNRLRPTMGATILREYGFNSDAVLAASSATDWAREIEDGLDYADLVILSLLHSAIGTEHARKVPPMHTIPAFARVTHGELSPSKSLAMIRTARALADKARPPDWQFSVA